MQRTALLISTLLLTPTGACRMTTPRCEDMSVLDQIEDGRALQITSRGAFAWIAWRGGQEGDVVDATGTVRTECTARRRALIARRILALQSPLRPEFKRKRKMRPGVPRSGPHSMQRP